MEYYILKCKKEPKYIYKVHERTVRSQEDSVNPKMDSTYKIELTENEKDALRFPTRASVNNMLAEYALERDFSAEYKRD